jgi:Mn2+/Fe2+ NRAMP family transporter
MFILVLVNRRELMGEYTNSRGYNAVAWSASAVMIVLTLALAYLGLRGKVSLLAGL